MSGYIKSPFTIVDEFLGKFGYMAVSEIYMALKSKNPADANTIYQKHKSWYHPVVAALIDRVLKS